MRNPLEQFEIKELIKIYLVRENIIITDIVLYIIIGIIILIIVEKEGGRVKITKKLVIKEVRKEIIEKIIRMVVTGKERYIILLKVMFMLIIIYNIIGMVPYNKTITSELVLTITISISLLIGITIIGIKNHKIKILKILIPENTPIILVPLLIMIETISYIARGISLGLRLGANMIAGHTLLKIIILFIYTYINMDINKEIIIENKMRIKDKEIDGISGAEQGIERRIREKESLIRINYIKIIKWIITLIPLIILTLIILLEIGVGIMQAIVFVIITGIYINDVEMKIK